MIYEECMVRIRRSLGITMVEAGTGQPVSTDFQSGSDGSVRV